LNDNEDSEKSTKKNTDSSDLFCSSTSKTSKTSKSEINLPIDNDKIQKEVMVLHNKESKIINMNEHNLKDIKKHTRFQTTIIQSPTKSSNLLKLKQIQIQK